MPSTLVRRRRAGRRASSFGLMARVERIKGLSHDLARELTRAAGPSVIALAIADAILHDADAVRRALKQKA